MNEQIILSKLYTYLKKKNIKLGAELIIRDSCVSIRWVITWYYGNRRTWELEMKKPGYNK